MRLLFKILALPFAMVTGLLYLVCKFLVLISGAVLGILSGIVSLSEQHQQPAGSAPEKIVAFYFPAMFRNGLDSALDLPQ